MLKLYFVSAIDHAGLGTGIIYSFYIAENEIEAKIKFDKEHKGYYAYKLGSIFAEEIKEVDGHKVIVQ